MVETEYPAHWLAAIGNAYEAFESLEQIFGHEIARLAWGRIPGNAPKKPRKPGQKPGPKKGPRKPEQAAFLLTAYDRITPPGFPVLKEIAPRKLGEALGSKFPGKYGLSAEAIERQIRRLLKRREASQDEMIRQLARSLVSADILNETPSTADSDIRSSGDKIP